MLYLILPLPQSLSCAPSCAPLSDQVKLQEQIRVQEGCVKCCFLQSRSEPIFFGPFLAASFFLRLPQISFLSSFSS